MLITRLKIYYSAIRKAVLLYVVQHNIVVAMSIDADIALLRETILHNAAKYAMHLWIAGNAMYHVIRSRVV